MSRAAPVFLSSSPCLNLYHTVLHGWPPNSPSKPPSLELFKLITSNHTLLPKPSQNQITTTTTAKTQPKSDHNKNPEAHQITNHSVKSREPQFHLKGSSELRGRDFHSLWLGNTIFDFFSWYGFRSLLSCQPRRRIKRNKMKKNKALRKKEKKMVREERQIEIKCTVVGIFLHFLLFFFLTF